MAKARKLKVYRTPIGFHDAYVAAPSQKAALEGWGSDHNLFARGVAEIVTDDALGAEPLARPGVVIKRLRGTTAEQIAALPADRARCQVGKTDRRSSSKARPKPIVVPSRDGLEAAERALSDAESQQERERDALGRKEAELTRQRRDLEKKHAAELAKLEAVRAKAEVAYRMEIDAAGP